MRPAIEAERPKLKKSGIKLDINTALGIAGVAAAPLTLGWSLLVTLGSGGMILWDGIDYYRDYSRQKPIRVRLRELRDEARECSTEIEAIWEVLKSRSGGASAKID